MKQLGNRISLLGVVALDAITYGVVLTVIAVLGAFVVSVTTGGGTGRANILLFVAGWTVMAYATVLLWPRKRTEEKTTKGYGEALPAEPRTKLHWIVSAVPPLRWLELPPPEYRLSQGGKLFVASVIILLTSFLLEYLGVVRY